MYDSFRTGMLGGRGKGEGQGPYEDWWRGQHAGSAGETIIPGPMALRVACLLLAED